MQEQKILDILYHSTVMKILQHTSTMTNECKKIKSLNVSKMRLTHYPWPIPVLHPTTTPHARMPRLTSTL